MRSAILLTILLAAPLLAAPPTVIFTGETLPLKVRLGSPLPAAVGTGFTKRNALESLGVGQVSFEAGYLQFSAAGEATCDTTGTAPGPANILIRSGSVTNALLPLVVAELRTQTFGGGCAWPYELLDCSTNIVPHSTDGFLEVVVDDGPGADAAVAVSVFIAGTCVGAVSNRAVFTLPFGGASYEVQYNGRTIRQGSGSAHSECIRGTSESSCCGGCASGSCGFGDGDLEFSETGGARFHVRLGSLDAGSSAGLVYLDFPAAPIVLSPLALQELLPPGTTVTRNPDGSLLTVACGAGRTLTVSQQGSSLVLTAASPFEDESCVWTLSNPSGNTSALRAVRTRGGLVIYDTEVALNASTWTRTRHGEPDPGQPAGPVLRTETLLVSSNGSAWVEERKTLGPDSSVLAWTRTAYTNFGSSGAPLRRVTRDETYWYDNNSEPVFHATDYTYWDAPGVPGRHGRPRLVMRYDDSWTHTAYDASGRVVTAASPWLDGAAPALGADNPFAFASSRVVSNCYASLDPAQDTLSLRPETPRTVSEYIVPESAPPRLMTRTFRLFCPTNWCGIAAVAEIVERAAGPTAAFGDVGDLRTVTISYPEETGDWRSGRTLCTLSPDDSQTTMIYQTGVANADGANFTPGGNATHLRVITVSGTAEHPSGLPGRTTFHVEVSDLQWLRTYLSETYVVTSTAPIADPTSHARIDWTGYSYDGRGRQTSVAYADGTAETNLWDCCHRVATIGRDGAERLYDYDFEGRLFREEDRSIAALPGSGGAYTATDTAYDALGRVTNTTRRVLINGAPAPGYTPLVSRTTFPDISGDTVITVDERGRETVRYRYLRDDSFWGDGIADTYRHSHADGAQFSEIQEWGAFWGEDLAWCQLTSMQAQGESVPRDGLIARSALRSGRVVDTTTMEEVWNAELSEAETLTDTLLGRTVASGRPGFDGAWIVTSNRYDAVARLSAVETWNDSTELLSRTLHAHDELGNLYRTALDLDLDDQIDLTGPDRVTDQYTWYEQRAAETLLGQSVAPGWWRTSCTVTYPHGTSVPFTNSLSRTRISGLGGSSGLGLLTAETLSRDASGSVVLTREHTDSSACRVTRQTFRGGVAEPETTVLVAGRVVSVTAPDESTVTYAHDGFGRRTAEAGPRDSLSLTGYGANGDVASTGVVDGSVTNVTTHISEYWSGFLWSSSSDPLQHEVSTYHAANGAPMYSYGNAVYYTQHAQDPFGRTVGLGLVRDEQDWSLDITRWLYDDATGLLTNKLYADGLGPSYAYYPDGKLATRTWARDLATDYAYTAANELASLDYSDATPDVTYAHDRTGRMVTAITAGVSTNLYAYTSAGLLTNEAVALCAPATLRETFSRSYDSHGRLSGIALGESYAVAYAFDDCGRLASVSNTAFTAAYAYAPGGINAGWTITVTNSNTISRVVTTDSYRGLITAVTNNVNGVPTDPLIYGHDAIGRVISRNGDAFGYNPRSEVTGASISTNVYGYAYDGIGNALWASLNWTTNTYTANELNQYTSIANGSTIEPECDTDGNLTWDGTFTYAWDAENRLVAAYSNNLCIVSNAYDHQSRRVLKVSYGGTEVRSFIYDGWNLVRETITTQQSVTTNHYIWGNDLSGTLQGAGGIGGLLAVQMGGVWYFPLFDHSGNVTAYASESGAIVAEFAYNPFGGTIAQSGAMADQFRFRFSTKYFDVETGLYYYGYRFYSLELMRWMSRDPVGQKGGLNLFAFVRNNPAGLVDILGRETTGASVRTAITDFSKCVKWRGEVQYETYVYRPAHLLLPIPIRYPVYWGVPQTLPGSAPSKRYRTGTRQEGCYFEARKLTVYAEPVFGFGSTTGECRLYGEDGRLRYEPMMSITTGHGTPSADLTWESTWSDVRLLWTYPDGIAQGVKRHCDYFFHGAVDARLTVHRKIRVASDDDDITLEPLGFHVYASPIGDPPPPPSSR